MKKGAQVAAYVNLEGRNTWVLVKIEKKQSGNKYVVHDELAESSKLERFVVEQSKLSLFPNTTAKYEIGQRVLSQWKNDDESDWTTELYDAEIVKISKGVFTLKFPPGNDLLDVGAGQITTYPEGFVLDEDEEEQKPEDDQQPEEEEKKETPPPPKTRGGRNSKKSRNHSKQHSIENTTTSDDNQRHPSTVNNTVSDESTSAHGETKEDASQASTQQMSTTTPPQSPQDTDSKKIQLIDEKPRTVSFHFNKVEQPDHTDLHLLTDDDFALSLPEKKPQKPIRIKEGTPLLDALSDPVLFDQIASHTTSSGMLFRNDLKPHEYKSALMEGKSSGRIGKIFQYWKESRQ